MRRAAATSPQPTPRPTSGHMHASAARRRTPSSTRPKLPPHLRGPRPAPPATSIHKWVPLSHAQASERGYRAALPRRCQRARGQVRRLGGHAHAHATYPHVNEPVVTRVVGAPSTSELRPSSDRLALLPLLDPCPAPPRFHRRLPSLARPSSPLLQPRRCIEAFEALTPEEQDEVLLSTILECEAAANCLRGLPTAEVAEIVGHLLSELPDETLCAPEDATRSRVITSLLTSEHSTWGLPMSAEARLDLAKNIVFKHPYPTQVGGPASSSTALLPCPTILPPISPTLSNTAQCGTVPASCPARPPSASRAHPCSPLGSLSAPLLAQAGEAIAELLIDGAQKGRFFQEAISGMATRLGVGSPGAAEASEQGGGGAAERTALRELRESMGVDAAELARLLDEARVAGAREALAHARGAGGLGYMGFGGGTGGSGGLSDAEAARLADLKRRKALGQLTPEEEEELRRLEALAAAAGGGGYYDADGNWVAGGSGHFDANGNWVAGGSGGLSDAEAARLADLKRRKALGQLTPEEEEELRRLEAKQVAALQSGGAGGVAAAQAEADAIKDRLAELRRRQAVPMRGSNPTYASPCEAPCDHHALTELYTPPHYLPMSGRSVLDRRASSLMRSSRSCAGWRAD